MQSSIMSLRSLVTWLVTIGVLLISIPVSAIPMGDLGVSAHCNNKEPKQYVAALTTHKKEADPNRKNHFYWVNEVIPGSQQPALTCKDSETYVSRFPRYDPEKKKLGVFGDDWVDENGKKIARIQDVRIYGETTPTGQVVASTVTTDTSLKFLTNNNGVFEIDDFISSMFNMLGKEHEFFVPYLSADRDIFVGIDLKTWITQGGTFQEGQTYDLVDGRSPLLPGVVIGTSEVYVADDLGLITYDPLSGTGIVTATATIDGELIPEPPTLTLVGLVLGILAFIRRRRIRAIGCAKERSASFVRRD